MQVQTAVSRIEREEEVKSGVSAGLDMKKEEEEEEKKGARQTLGSDIRDKVTPIHPPLLLLFCVVRSGELQK